MPNLKNIMIYTLRIKQIVIGPVVKRYGPFGLHALDYVLKGGRTMNSSQYFIVVGELAETLILNFGTRSDDPAGYLYIIRDRHGPFHDCIHVGDIPINRSTYHDLWNRVDYWLRTQQIGIDCYADQLAVASDASTGNTRREETYRHLVTKLQDQSETVNHALQQFLREYPDAAVGTKRDIKALTREAHQARKGFSKAIWTINRFVE